jgi:hypothetical protein
MATTISSGERLAQEAPDTIRLNVAAAIGVNVALATAAVAAQELYPLLGHGPIAHEDLATIQQLREGDVRTLHRFQLRAQRLLLS